MHIVIAGAGTLGQGAVEKLAKENHELVLIDNDPAKIDRVSNSVDCQTVLACATSEKALRSAGIEKADMFLALTNDDNVNIVSGMIAREFNVPIKICKIGDPEFHNEDHILQLKRHKIFDLIISPDKAAADEIIRLFEMPVASDFNYFAKNKGAIVAVTIDKDHHFAGKYISELRNEGIGTDKIIAAIDRDNGTLIPTEDLQILENDTIYVAGSRWVIRKFARERTQSDMRQIIIVGGGHLSLAVARELENILQVKIIESDFARCEELAVQLSKAMVLHGDGTDTVLLKSEKIENCQALISVTRDEESNILIGLLGKSLGAQKAFCLTQKQDYSKLVAKLGIDATISPRTAAISEITRFVRKGYVEKVISFKANNAEAIEFVVPTGASITKAPIAQLKLPTDVLIGGVVRGGAFEIPVGSSSIHPGDHVIVFALPEQIPDAEAFFSNEDLPLN